MVAGSSQSLLVGVANLLYAKTSVKAYGSIIGIDGSLAGGFGLSSSRSSQGDFTITLDHDMSSSTYTIGTTVEEITTNTSGMHAIVRTRTVSGFTVKVTSNGSDFDPTRLNVWVFGDLA